MKTSFSVSPFSFPSLDSKYGKVTDFMTQPELEVTRGIKISGNMFYVRNFRSDAIVMIRPKPHKVLSTQVGSTFVPYNDDIYNAVRFPSSAEVEGWTLVHLNALLAQEWFEIMKQKLHFWTTQVLGSSQEFVDQLDYYDHLNEMMAMGQEWKVGGFNKTTPDANQEKVRLNSVRHIVTGLRDQKFCENLWGPKLYGQNSAFIVLKPIRVTDDELVYTLANGEQVRAISPFPIRTDLNTCHYIPQFVAIQTPKSYGLPSTGMMFPITKKTRTGEVFTSYHAAIPYYIGRCDINNGNTHGPTNLEESETLINNEIEIMRRPSVNMTFFIN